jgi:methylmalonyl-CoA/ethylmalonyl-CoA epimerase
MIGRLNHVAIAVPDLPAAARKYRELLGADVSEAEDLPDHGVTVVFVRFSNTKLELMAPFGPDSPIMSFMKKHPGGGMHHICYEVPDIAAAVATLTVGGARVLGEVKTGAHGLPVAFLHPKDFDGTLIELEEVKPEILPA